MILVLGATGSVGGHVVTELCRRGEPVRALVATPEEADALRGYDCAVSVDGRDDAWAGVERVLAVGDLPPRAEQLRAVVVVGPGEQVPVPPHGTVLRHPGLLQDLLLDGAGALQAGELRWPGDAPLVDARDVAAVAGHLLCSDGHEGRTYDVTGPELLRGEQVAARLSALLGREIALRATAGPLEPYPEAPTGEVEAGTGRPARTLDDFLADHLAAFR